MPGTATPKLAAIVPVKKLRLVITIVIPRCLMPFDRRRRAGSAAVFRQRRQAPDRGFGALPGLWPLRRVAMPRPRIEIAERFVLHLIEIDVELDGVLVRIAVIGGDVVAGTVAERPPQQPDVLVREHLACRLD